MIRAATAADGAAIAAVFLAARKATMDYLPVLHTDDEIGAWIAGPMMADCRVWVAGGDPIDGFLALHGTRIDHLYVAPARQGRGIGTALLRYAQSISDRLTLRVFAQNAGAARLYAREGFRVTSRGDGSTNEERLPDMEMAWDAAALEVRPASP